MTGNVMREIQDVMQQRATAPSVRWMKLSSCCAPVDVIIVETLRLLKRRRNIV